ncbi:MAG: NfeD family protein [bacterium]
MMIVIALVVIGFFLLIVEMFLPGLVAGAVGVACLVGASVSAFHRFGPEMGAYVVAGEIVFLIILFFLWVKFFPSSAFGRLFALKQEPPKQSSASENFSKLLGSTGVALTPLRPSGVASINGHRHDVVTEGMHVEAGKDIKVVNVEGARIVVRLFNST